MGDLIKGSTFAGCRLEALAGRGGMGVVWRATQVALGRPVALKAIAPQLAQDNAYRERFQRESRLTASIDHPNVIPVYEAGELEGTLYLIMRWVEGIDLRGLLQAEGPLPAGRATRLLRPVASALAAAHRRGLIHRDIKPSNVLIATADDASEEHVYLTDFGIARRSESHGLTRTGVLVGTIDYISPERIQGGKGTPASDIYAFGCMLFETLTGHVPFARESEVAKMYAHMSEPVPLDALPPAMAPIVERAMAKLPEDRFATAAELVSALDDALEQRPGAEPTAIAAATGTPTVLSEPEPPPTAPAAAPVDPTALGMTAPGPAPVPDIPVPTAPSPTAPVPPPSARRRRIPVLPLAALALAAVLAAVAAALSSGGGSTKSKAPGVASGPPRLVSGVGVRIGNPGTVPGTPLALAAAGRDVWAATRDRVVQFSSTGATGIVDATGGVGSVTAAGVDAQGRLWLAGAGTSGIQKVGGNVVETGSDLRLLTLSSGAAWLADTGATSVTQVGLGDLASALPIPVAGPVGALGDAYGRIWVASRNGAVTVLNGDGSRSSLSAPDVTPGTVGIAPSNGVWFLSGSGALDRIDPRTDPSVAVGGRYARHPVHIRAGREAAGIGAAAGTDSIWVLSRAERSLTRIGTSGVGNPKVTARVVFPAVPGHLAVGDHVAWVDVPSTRRVYPITF